MIDNNDKRAIAHDEWLTEPIDEEFNHPALCSQCRVEFDYPGDPDTLKAILCPNCKSDSDFANQLN